LRSLLLVVLVWVCCVAPTHAAWVWVYEGEKHVVMPPAEGQPEWASYPDANGDGKPDPIITNIDLRIEDDQGEAITKARVGQTIYLVAVPELGGLEMETLTVRLRLSSPSGDLAVVPDEPIRKPTALGAAPSTYRAQYAIPEEPVAEHVGQYEATVEIELGAARSTPAMTSVVELRVVGPRETLPEKVAREVKMGLTRAGEEISKFGQRVATEVGAWVERTKQPPPPRALQVVHERQTRGMVEELLQEPAGIAAADRERLALDRGAALRSKTGPPRSVIVVPFDAAGEMDSDGSSPIGYLATSGLRVPGPAGAEEQPAPASAHCYRLLLESAAEDEVTVGIRLADGTPLLSLPVEAKWFNSLPWPGESALKVERHPDADTDGLVTAELVSAVTGGAIRALFTLPIVPAEPEEPEEPAEVGPPTPEG